MPDPMSDRMPDLTLNNGETAYYKGTDFWSRPYYEITIGDRKHLVCCVELNGTYLHTYSNCRDVDSDPCSPLKHEWQPRT